MQIFTTCYHRLKVCVLPKSVCWNLNLNVMIFGSGSFGSQLGHEGGAFMSGIIKETPDCFLDFLLLLEDPEKRQSPMDQPASPHQTPNLSGSRSWASQPLELWDISTVSEPLNPRYFVTTVHMDGGTWKYVCSLKLKSILNFNDGKTSTKQGTNGRQFGND